MFFERVWKTIKRLISLVLLLYFLFTLLPFVSYSITVESYVQGNEQEIHDISIDEDFAEDRLLVVMKSTQDVKDYKVEDFPELNVADVDEITAETKKVLKGKDSGIIAATADSCLNTSDYKQVLLLKLENHGKEEVIRAANLIMARQDVYYAGPDYAMDIMTTTPDDTYFSSHQIEPSTLIGLQDAWDITTGSSTVRVGVIDTGIDSAHPDLADRISDTLSRDFTTGSTIATPSPTDPNGHGTHVAGIIGAHGDNDRGVCGVCWNVELVSLRVFDDSGQGYSSYALAAIDYATANNIPILNLSGWSSSNPRYDVPLNSVIANYHGLLVCAAGNTPSGGIDIDEHTCFPTSLPLENIISVANSTSSDNLASNSNFGASTVDLAAPGTNIYSTYINTSGYNYLSGTSMAAPFVTGVAALIKSIRPDLSATEIKALILYNVDKRDPLEGKCVTGGRLNAYKAVRAATEPQTFTGDVNGDGRADIIMSRKVNGKRAITTYLGKSDGKFTEPITTTSTRTFIYSDPAFVGDFNGDGKTDLLIHWSTAGYRQLLVYKSNGDGTFSEGQNLYSTRAHNPVSLPCSFHVGDVNGDGKDDFIVHYRDWNGHRCALVYKGRTTEPYVYDATTTALTSTNMYRSNDPVYVGDFNGDGRDDMVVHWATNGFRQLLVYTANSDASFNSGANLYSSRAYNPSVNPSKNFIADVNGDGKDDFVVHWKNTTGYRNNLVYKGKSASPYFFDATTDALNSGNHYVLTDPVFVGDTTGDGRTDMIVHWTNYEGKRQLLTYKAKSDGTYNLGNNYPTDNANDPYVYAERYFVDDVDGDGKDDFIVKWKNSSGMVRFYTYRGKSDASFQAAAKTTPSINVPYYN